MANIQERRNKQGELISYSIRVHRGRSSNGKQLTPYATTFEVQPTWSEATALKKAQAYAAVFEKECREGSISNSKITFREYCEYVIDLKSRRGLKTSTIERYRELTGRIYEHIGDTKICCLTPKMLNKFYNFLQCDAVNLKTGGRLSSKTVLEHHRLISGVLEHALKEGEVTYNAAKRAEPPKVKKKPVNYFQPEELISFNEAMQKEDLKHQTLFTLFVITGARRGEVLGLKWADIDIENSTVSFHRSILYSRQKGVYESDLKTTESVRTVVIPDSTVELLKKYKRWQEEQIEYFDGYYVDNGFVFAQDNGNPMHPDSITDYFSKFSKKYGLKHCNPHAFRHTAASLLYSAGADSVSISKRLGHTQVSTTANIYAHVIGGVDKKNAAILESFLNNPDE